MIDFSTLELSQLAVHFVGNRQLEESLHLSESLVSLEEPISDLLMGYFTRPFRSNLYYHLNSQLKGEENSLFSLISGVFENPDSLMDVSKKLAEQLYDKSNHPKIKGGEFYVCHFTECIVESEVVDVIGLFKSENKETYLKVMQKKQGFQINADSGININRLDKGCLIFNTDKENGYLVSMVDIDRTEGSEAIYWKDQFLGLNVRQDPYFQTQEYLNIYKDYCDNAFKNEKEINKKDQIEMLNRGVDYFSGNEIFDESEFASEVIAEPKLIDSFNDYKSAYTNSRNLKPMESFEISQDAIKSKKKWGRSVIKLDKNFHVYVHGDFEKLEKGYDEDRGLNFYKLYFENEE